MLPRIRFEWDEAKDRANRLKHGVSFADATALFLRDDDATLVTFDADHSEFEDRFIAIGPSNERLPVAVFIEPDEGCIRIISARRAHEGERALYRGYHAASRRREWPS